MGPKELEYLENQYLTEFFYFLKFAERRLLQGFDTKEKIKEDWYKQWNPKDDRKGISHFAIGAERIVYAFFNTQGFGQPNSAPVGSDLFFETPDAFIHIDLKTVQTRNIGDYTTTIFVGNNQNSYKGTIKKRGAAKNEEYQGELPTEYKNKGNPKPCLTYFVTILYDEDSLDILNINLLCLPNGSLNSVYGSRPLKAGKNHGKMRYNIKDANTFELLDKKPKRIKVVYFKENMNDRWKQSLEYIKSIYDEQQKIPSSNQ